MRPRRKSSWASFLPIELLTDIALIAEELADKTLGKFAHGDRVVDIAGRELKSDNFTLRSEDVV